MCGEDGAGNMSELALAIFFYYDERDLLWPDFEQAMAFAHTEIGEAYEVYLAQFEGWVRNDPDHEPFSAARLAEELGDAIMMLVVAGIAYGIDPVQALREKMAHKLIELRRRRDGNGK